MRHARKDYDRIQDPANLIPAAEPVFLLRGQDLLAPATLRYYAASLRTQADFEPGITQEMKEGLERMAVTVEAQANLMDAWHTNKKFKVPDLPEEQLPCPGCHLRTCNGECMMNQRFKGDRPQ